MRIDIQDTLSHCPGVERIINESNKFKLVSKDFQQNPSIIKLDHACEIGNKKTYHDSPVKNSDKGVPDFYFIEAHIYIYILNISTS